ncbi:hypothetical protein FACS1894166_02240 [Bacilli bacterium]|nr:hypothetical protein FACS1894166_02240 [Bacilli bacterium]
MSYISLFRKYRPQAFTQVVGQDFITTTLKNSIRQNKVGHAYIFAGPKGIGKTTIARVFAKALNCLTPIEGDACNKCENCKAIDQFSTDIVELDAASNNGVEDVRNIIDGVTSLPTMLKKRVYIIDETHMLTTAA